MILNRIELFLNILNQTFDRVMEVLITWSTFSLLDHISSDCHDLSKMVQRLFLWQIFIRNLTFDILNVFEMIKSFNYLNKSLKIDYVSFNHIIFLVLNMNRLSWSKVLIIILWPVLSMFILFIIHSKQINNLIQLNLFYLALLIVWTRRCDLFVLIFLFLSGIIWSYRSWVVLLIIFLF